MPFDLVQITFKTRRFPAVNTDMHPRLGGSGLLLSNTHTNTNSLFITHTKMLSISPPHTHWHKPCCVLSHALCLHSGLYEKHGGLGHARLKIHGMPPSPSLLFVIALTILVNCWQFNISQYTVGEKYQSLIWQHAVTERLRKQLYLLFPSTQGLN